MVRSLPRVNRGRAGGLCVAQQQQFFLAITGFHQDGLTACPVSRFDVPQFIANHVTGLQVELKFLCGAKEKSGLGFATIAGPGMLSRSLRGMVRAVVIGIEASPFLTKGIIDLAVQPLQVLLSDETAGDARLVGNDDHPEARPVQTSNRLEAPRNGLPLVDRLDVVVGVLVVDAVAVEQNELQWSRYSA